MDRQEALHAAIDGHKIIHPSYLKGNYLFFDKGTSQLRVFQSIWGSSMTYDILQHKDGYEIMQEEKTMVKYVNIYKETTGNAILHRSRESAKEKRIKSFHCIACKKVVIKYYEGEGLE